MTWFQIVAPPVIGGIIGYVTNMLAIKMLFKPLKPVMIGRFRVPFTPGIVPKRKEKLAGVLGQAISTSFWGLDELESIFTSDTFKTAIVDRIMAVLEAPESKLSFLDPDLAKINTPLYRVKEELCVRIQAALLKSDLKQLITEQYGRIMHDRFGSGMVTKVLNEKTVSLVLTPIWDNIENDLLKNGQLIIMPIIDDELRDLSREPFANIVDEMMPDKEAQRALISDIYTKFINDNVRPIVETIDIGSMITEKVRQMDDAGLEELTLSVVSGELRYVIMLGGLIGAIIGAVNIFI